MGADLRWDREGRDWPHRQASRFVVAAGLRWHVQQMGDAAASPDRAGPAIDARPALPSVGPGAAPAAAHAQAEPQAQASDRRAPRKPVALLIHGTGASTHSWRGLMPLLAPHFEVIAFDLPGHAFTGTPPAERLGLPGMAASVAELVEVLGLVVDLVVGHSAGAAIGARLVLDGVLEPRAVVSINGAWLPLAGLPGLLFPPVARLMAATPLAPKLFARRDWDRAAVEKLIDGTGSTLDETGLALYATLLRDARHAAGALGMMARWDLRPLARDLARWHTPLALIVGANDRAVPPHDAARVRALLPTSARCTVDSVRDSGHLAHEERPDEVARLSMSAWFDEGARRR
jgi:magnesium chelatase accessory protein